MSVSEKTRREVWVKAGGRCAFLDCRKELIAPATEQDPSATLGEIAHIVAQGKDGPRSGLAVPGGELHGAENLILLCQACHEIIDSQPQTYPLEKLIQIRSDHEEWVRKSLSPMEASTGVYFTDENVVEEIHSTLLPVSRMPCHIFSGQTEIRKPAEINSLLEWPRGQQSVMLPFILKEGRLYCFSDLRKKNNPFRNCVSGENIEKIEVEEWWDDDVKFLWFVELLNRCLNKLTGRKGLNFDKDHRRYHFVPTSDGEEVSKTYTSLEGRKATRSVCWQPKRRATGEKKNFWEHLAVGLRFHRVGSKSWCLSMRPERRFTRDGIESIEPKNTGRRSTSRKSRMYNLDVLSEVNFWRDFLSDGRPRIALHFGDQNLTIETRMLSGEISWPGVPDDAKPFAHTEFEEDLWSMAEIAEWDNEDWEGEEE